MKARSASGAVARVVRPAEQDECDAVGFGVGRSEELIVIHLPHGVLGQAPQFLQLAEDVSKVVLPNWLVHSLVLRKRPSLKGRHEAERSQ